MIENWSDVVLVLKYIVATMVVITIILAPWYLACQNKREKPAAMAARLASTVFLLSGIGWFIALFIASRK